MGGLAVAAGLTHAVLAPADRYEATLTGLLLYVPPARSRDRIFNGETSGAGWEATTS